MRRDIQPFQRRLGPIAKHQRGMFTRAQANDLGVERHIRQMAAEGHVVEVVRGVYQFAFTPEKRTDELYARWLALEPHTPADARISRPEGPGIFVSHTSAVLLFGYGKFIDTADSTFVVSDDIEALDVPGVRLYSGSISPDEWVVEDGLPTVRPSRTIVHLLEEHFSGDDVGAVIADALRAGTSTVDTLFPNLDPLAPRFGLQSGEELARSLLAQEGLSLDDFIGRPGQDFGDQVQGPGKFLEGPIMWLGRSPA